MLIHPIYWCLPFFKQKLTSIYKYRRGLKYKCNENYFEFTLRSKGSSFRSFLISRIAICFIASKGERGATQVRYQDNRYQLRLCWAKRNKSSPLGRDHQRDVIKAGRKGVWRGKHGNNLILHTVANGQQWNQGGVPRTGGGWFNLAHFEAHLCAMSSWVSEMPRDGQGMGDLDLLLVMRMVNHPQSLTFRPCPYEIRWTAVYNKLWATQRVEPQALSRPPTGDGGGRQEEHEGFRPWRQAGHWEPEGWWGALQTKLTYFPILPKVRNPQKKE